jgi:hypothetical protein
MLNCLYKKVIVTIGLTIEPEQGGFKAKDYRPNYTPDRLFTDTQHGLATILKKIVGSFH